MSLWSMNDGSSLSGTHTFTNGSAIVQANASGAYKSELKIGDVMTTAGGEKVRVKNLTPPRTVATSDVNASNERITITAHGYTANTPLTYSAAGGTAIAGLTDGQIVFVKTVHDANTIDLSATEGGSVIDLTGTGNNSQTFIGETNTGVTLTADFGGSTESGVAATVSRPPIDGHGGTIDANVLGIDEGESVAGVDNVTDIALTSTTGARYVQAPTITVAGPTARTLATSNVSLANDTFTLTNHNLRTGTSLTYNSQGGTNLAQNSGNIADDTELFVIRVDADTIKLASSLSNAQAGTALDITGAGNNAQTFVGDTATVTTSTVTLSGGKVTSIPVAAVGSDYQAAPTVTVAAPGEQTFNAQSAVSTANDTITLTAHSFATGDAFTYADKGGTVLANLTDGGTSVSYTHLTLPTKRIV